MAARSLSRSPSPPGAALLPYADSDSERHDRGSVLDPAAPFNVIFEAGGEATGEATLNALFQADITRGRDGNVLHGAPIERILAFL